MRLFIAVNFNGEIKDQILVLQEQLRDQSLRGNFTRPENLHLTLAFLGETPEEKIGSICRIIEDIKTPPFEIRFSRTGCFTHSGKELWWIGADPDSPGLALLQAAHRRLVDLLLEAGLPVDSRSFNAHITLGREIKHSGPIILDNPEITVRVDRVSLMKSEHIRGLLTYSEIFGFSDS